LLRVAIGQELERALEVGEEDGDLLALALEGGPGGEDLVGKVLRGVGVRGAEARRGGRPGGVGALRAELGGGGEGRAAVGAGAGERRRALLAELRPRLILVLAAETSHARASRSSASHGLSDVGAA